MLRNRDVWFAAALVIASFVLMVWVGIGHAWPTWIVWLTAAAGAAATLRVRQHGDRGWRILAGLTALNMLTLVIGTFR